MEKISNRLRQIKDERKDVYNEITAGKIPSIGVDDTRISYFHTELETLTIVLDLLERQAYKECFILIRTVLEKFLYFWLMMDGKMYRQINYYHITKNASKTVREARDKTYELWRKEWKTGHPNYKYTIDIQKGKEDDLIIRVSEFEGPFMKEDKEMKGEIIPLYNFALNEYSPDMAHLSKLKTLDEGRIFAGEGYNNQVKTHQSMYHLYFYIESIVRNLVLNKLVSEEQKDMIMVHYNFLSSFVHPSKAGVQMWENMQRGMLSMSQFEEDTFKELIILYVAKFMQLYIKALIFGYRRDWKIFKSDKYDKMLEELDLMSRDLWFIDNNPTEFDIKSSESRKYAASILRKKMKNSQKVLYYDDPLQRMDIIRKSRRRR